jgi:hypothetical protein
MIVDRRVYHVKRGCEEALVNLLKETIEGNTTYTRSYRIYTPNISTYGVVIVEWEFENLQEMEVVWDAWAASPASSTFFEKWNELTKLGGSGEVWNLVAHR